MLLSVFVILYINIGSVTESMVRTSTSPPSGRLPPIGKADTATDHDSNSDDALAGVSDIPRLVANEGRLEKINDIASKRMEHISIINDMQKEKLRIESDKLDKQIRTMDARYAKDVEPLRRSYEELKATMLFLERKRLLMKEETAMQRGMFGSCGGINRYELRDEITKIMDSTKPSRQRQRKINRLKEKGKQDGRIVDDIDIMRKFNTMMKRPFRTPIRPRPKIMIAEKKDRKRSFKLPALATVVQNDKGYGNFFSSGPIRLVLEKS